MRCHFSVPSNGRVMLNAVAVLIVDVVVAVVVVLIVVVVVVGLDAQQESETFQIVSTFILSSNFFATTVQILCQNFV